MAHCICSEGINYLYLQYRYFLSSIPFHEDSRKLTQRKRKNGHPRGHENAHKRRMRSRYNPFTVGGRSLQAWVQNLHRQESVIKFVVVIQFAVYVDGGKIVTWREK